MNKLAIEQFALSLICVVAISFLSPSTYGQQDAIKDGMTSVKMILSRIKESGGVSHLPLEEQNRLVADIQGTLSVVQAEETAITNENAKLILECLKVLSYANVGDHDAVRASIQRMAMYCLPNVETLDGNRSRPGEE